MAKQQHTLVEQLKAEIGDLRHCPDCKREIVPKITVPANPERWESTSCSRQSFEHAGGPEGRTVRLVLTDYGAICEYDDPQPGKSTFKITVEAHGLHAHGARAMKAALLAAAELGFLTLS